MNARQISLRKKAGRKSERLLWVLVSLEKSLCLAIFTLLAICQIDTTAGEAADNPKNPCLQYITAITKFGSVQMTGVASVNPADTEIAKFSLDDADQGS
jgi:hypothetical protein